MEETNHLTDGADETTGAVTLSPEDFEAALQRARDEGAKKQRELDDTDERPFYDRLAMKACKDVVSSPAPKRRRGGTSGSSGLTETLAGVAPDEVRPWKDFQVPGKADHITDESPYAKLRTPMTSSVLLQWPKSVFTTKRP